MKDASQRVRAEGLNGAAVAAVMRDTGLTHGGFYKHFESKDELLIESLKESFRDIIDTLVRAAEQSFPGEAWKAIVKTYLRPEMCDHPEHGCPLATLAPELARVDKRMKPQIVAELVNYKSRMLPFMPGRRTADKERAFFAIFSTMIGVRYTDAMSQLGLCCWGECRFQLQPSRSLRRFAEPKLRPESTKSRASGPNFCRCLSTARACIFELAQNPSFVVLFVRAKAVFLRTFAQLMER